MSDERVIFVIALAQIVQQRRQMQDILFRDARYAAPKGPGSWSRSRSPLDGPQRVLVDRVTMILIELQETAGVSHRGNDNLEGRPS